MQSQVWRSVCVGLFVVGIAACGGVRASPVDDGGIDGRSTDANELGDAADGSTSPHPIADAGAAADADAGAAADADGGVPLGDAGSGSMCIPACGDAQFCYVIAWAGGRYPLLDPVGDAGSDAGAGPVPGCNASPAACGHQRVPSCDCLLKELALECTSPEPLSCRIDSDGRPTVTCTRVTISRREFKSDISYVEADERAELAREALAIRLSRYRYKTEPNASRRRLGFIIDDQPKDSTAVEDDRTHVDLYGYTSMLLAALQEQDRELRLLRQRVTQLERRTPPPPGPGR